MPGAFRIPAVIGFALVGFAIGLVIDVFCLNYQALESQTFSGVEPFAVEASGDLDSDKTKNGAQLYRFEYDDVKNIVIEFTATQATRSLSNGKLQFDIWLTDEGNALPYNVGSVSLRQSESGFARIHPAGKVTSVRVAPKKVNSDDVEFSCSFNAPIGVRLHSILWVACALLALLAYALRPSSSVWTETVASRKWICPAAALACSSLLVIGAAALADYSQMDQPQQTQYALLARSLAQGEVALDLEVPEEILDMDNPYDTLLRASSITRAYTHEDLASGEFYAWDHAYFNGRYYSYFGVLPCVLFFLPYHVVTGGDLPYVIPALISLFLASIALFKLAWSIYRRWFPACSCGLFIVVCMALVSGSCVGFGVLNPTHYTIPLMLGIVLAAFGLSLWIDATSSGQLSVWKAVIGSALIASCVLCRPQQILAGCLAILLFVQHVRTYRESPSRQIRCLVLSIAVLVAALVVQGAYNYARFGDVLDFGANYNLTTNDMTHRGFSVDRIPLAIVWFLFQPYTLQPDWPILQHVRPASLFYGRVVAEDVLAGIFWLAPLLFAPLIAFAKRFRKKVPTECLVLAGTSLLCALAVIVFDANGAGILERYFLDFGFLLAFASALVIPFLWCNTDHLKREPAAPDEMVLDGNAVGKARFSVTGLILMALFWLSFAPMLGVSLA